MPPSWANLARISGAAAERASQLCYYGHIVTQERVPLSDIQTDVAIFSPLGRSGTHLHGGITPVVLRLASAMADQGVHVELVTFAPKDIRSLFPQLDRRLSVFNLGVGSRVRHLAALRAYLRMRRPGALLAAGIRANLLAALCKRMPGRVSPTFLSIHDVITPGLARLGFFAQLSRRFALRFLYPVADGLICVSAGVAEDLSSYSGVTVDKLTVIHNPILAADALKKAQEEPDHPWLRDGQVQVIMGAGRLEAQKDFPTLIRAFALLRKRHDCRLIILGEGKERGALLRLTAALGLEDCVSLPGFVRNPMAYMRRASLFVLSSAWEGFGNVLVEAMAVGTPVVSTDCQSGPREILRDGEFGLLVAPGDPTTLAEAMVATVASPLPAEALQRRAADFRADIAARRYLKRLLPAWVQR